MRVLHVITSLGAIGGAERMLQRLALAQGGEVGMQVQVVSLMEGGALSEELQSKGITVHTLGLADATTLWRAIWRLRGIIAQERPDIVQTWLYHADLVGGIAARLAGHRRIVWGIRNTDLFLGDGVSRTLGLIMFFCARLSRRVPSAIVCVAEAARQSHVRFGYAAEKMLVIPNGFPDLRHASPALRLTVREELGIPADALVVGSLGRFNAYKDQSNFVKAMDRVGAQRPDAFFLMVGREIDSNLALARWIAETGRADRFKRVGEQGDVAGYFAAMDIFTLHSKSEGFPNVLAEAMLAGLPAVATDVGDARLLSEGYADIVAPGDSAALADAVLSLMAMRETERASKGEAGRRHVLARYSLKVIVERYRDLYEDLCSGYLPGTRLDGGGISS
jgi:glycosyltransferase involved in cell wall biosynthesis